MKQDRTFATWGEMLRFVSEAPRNSRGQQSRATGPDRKKWSGTPTFDAALALAREGWAEGASRARAQAHRLETRLLKRIVRADINYDVEGMAFDVARYLSGEPEHWVREDESTLAFNGTRHVRLEVNDGCSSGVPTETVIARGAVLCALVTLLEYADQRVELWVTHTASDGAYTLTDRTRVKAYDQPLDEGRIAFAVMHPSMHRRLDFALIERADAPIARTMVDESGGYGRPIDTPAGEENAVVIGSTKAWGGECDWTSPESCEAWVLAQLARQGVVLRDED